MKDPYKPTPSTLHSLCTHRWHQQSNPLFFRYHMLVLFLPEVFPVSFGFHIPKGAPGSADTAKQHSIHPTSAPHPPARLPPSLLVHMQRKEASPLWQQQNTTLQKRCAPLTVTIKKGVDRIRAGDDDLRGRDVQKEARREEKRFSFPLSLFFIPFFLFYLFIYLLFDFSFLFLLRIHQASLDTCLTWGGVNLPRGWGPLFSSACHSSPSPFPFPVNLHFKTGDEPIKDGH